MTGEPRALERFPIHLGPGGRAVVLPEFTGAMDWYEAYGAAHGGDGAEGRLVSLHRFEADWQSWEMHPAGDELVLCLEGALVLVQELPDGTVRSMALGKGDYAINPVGTWHTADADGPCAVLFVTAGLGTQHRPR